MAHAAGSTITAASSLKSSGTAWSWLSWATMAVDQPPPVSAQEPICRPGSISPRARFWQLPVRPAAQNEHGGSMPRGMQLRTGSTTTRPSSESATISWPGTNGNETMGSK